MSQKLYDEAPRLEETNQVGFHDLARAMIFKVTKSEKTSN